MQIKIKFLILFCLILPGKMFPQDETYTAQRYKEIGDDYRLQKNKLSAVEYYKKSLQKNNDFVPTLISMGTLMREFGSYEESRQYLKKANELDEVNKEAIEEIIKTEILRADFKSAEVFLDKGNKAFPQDANFEYLQSRLFILKKQYYLAEKKLNQIIKNNPGHLESLIALGDLYLDEKRYVQARNYFEKARLISPENPQVFIGLFNVGFNETITREGEEIFKKKSDIAFFDDALEYLFNAKEYDNDFVPANLLLGKIYALSNDCDRARDYLLGVLKINPNHVVAQYYLGYCFPEESLTRYKTLLEKNLNNEIIRYAYERNLTKYSKRRENEMLLEMARQHYDEGMGLFKAHMTHHGVFEMNWARYLYPSFIPVHQELYQYFRSKKDYVKMGDELNFLRKVSGNVLYQDTYEMLVEKRKEKLHYREKIFRPEEEKTLTPIYVFHFLPETFLGDYPDAGEAISEKLLFALEETGRVKIMTGSQKSEINLSLSSKNTFGAGIFYNAINGKKTLEYLRKIFLSEKGFNPDYVRYAINGRFKEIGGGLEVNAEIIDLETGISFGQYRVKSSGRGYLRDIASKLADHIYKNIPFYGKIIKISSNGVVINLGEREGITKDTILGVYRNGQKLVTLDVSILDMDLLWAKPRIFSDIYRIQPGDVVLVEKSENKTGQNTPKK